MQVTKYLVLYSATSGDQSKRPVLKIYNTLQDGSWGVLKQDIIDKGIIVNQIPSVPKKVGKIHKLFIDEVNHTFSYEYIDPPIRPESKEISELRQSLEITNSQLDELFLNM